MDQKTVIQHTSSNTSWSEDSGWSAHGALVDVIRALQR